MILDRSQPYDEVYGIEGAAYSQAGHLFRPNGWLVGADVPDELPPEPKGDGWSSKHWKVLKAAVEQYDHAWVDKADAVAFLEGLSNVDG